MIGRILERDVKVKKMILDIYEFVLIMFKLKIFENVFGLERSMCIVIIECFIKELERKCYFIVVVGKIDGM